MTILFYRRCLFVIDIWQYTMLLCGIYWIFSWRSIFLTLWWFYIWNTKWFLNVLASSFAQLLLFQVITSTWYLHHPISLLICRALGSLQCWRALLGRTFCLVDLVFNAFTLLRWTMLMLKLSYDTHWKISQMISRNYVRLIIAGIVTRRPLVLQLHRIDEGREYAEFMHLPRKSFTDFGIFIVINDFSSSENCYLATSCVLMFSRQPLA